MVLLSNAEEWCSGSLLNNTAQNFRPFFLTAFHCIDSDHNDALSEEEISNAENWMFRFQYRKLSCESSTLTNTVTFNRADFRAAWNNTDFALMEMENTPLGDTRFTWLGWDRTGNTPSSGTGIHHPAGDVMKISFDDDELDTSSWGGPDNHWLVHFDDGVVQHGSSGSSLLDQNKRIIGQLHGNQNYNNSLSYCDQPRAEYGRLSISWDGANTDASRLSNWLDPCGTGSQTMNTLQSVFIEGSNLVCSSGSTYNINNLLSGTPATWTSSSNITFPLGNTGSSVSAKAYSSSSSGTGWIEATINGACGEVTLPRKDVWVGTPIKPYDITFYPYKPCLNQNVIALVRANNPVESQVYYNWRNTHFYRSQNSSGSEVHFQTLTRIYYTTYVYVKGTNECGSSTEYSELLRVKDCGGITPVPVSINPIPENEKIEGDLALSYEETKSKQLGVTQMELEPANAITSVTIYPNPVEDIINVQIPGNLIVDNNCSIEIYNLAGKLLLKKKVTSTTNSIDLSNLPSGTYIVKLIMDQEIITKKIIKK